MKWNRESADRLTSDTMPAYKVVRFRIDEQKLFRASFKGEFIGIVTKRARDAQDICENHHLITQEAKELPDVSQSQTAEREEVQA